MKRKSHAALRKAVQAIWGLLTNAHLSGFVKGTIYQGPLKRFCVPGMNCYSCPGALGACPIGAMQALFNGRRRRFAFSVVGYLAAVGLLAGRFVCGWLCLFGLLQELLYKIPTPKLKVPEKADRVLRLLKYGVLLILVFALPFFWRGEGGAGEPFFCKYLCPVGTLEAGAPLVLLRGELRAAVGLLFRWKLLWLALILFSSVFVYRPFCKYLCPLGAFYSLFQKISLLRLSLDGEKCVSCGKCERTCPMDVRVTADPNSAECIRCGACVRSCPSGALHFTGGRWKLDGGASPSRKKPE
ncbi:MAG: 4Fe-4S binding protein [Oscillospiraceae bacterium]|nr:4Fe-4S binding protein [Oscillospiraceae bacterium]